MKQVLTIVVKLQPSPEQVAFLEATLQAFADACNYVNEHTDPKLTNKIAIQSLAYQTIKSQFNLVANMAVRACARVAANRKVAFSNNGANNIAIVGLFINQPGGTGLSCKLNRTPKYVQRSTERSRRSLNLFDD